MKHQIQRMIICLGLAALATFSLACKKNVSFDDSPQQRALVEQLSRNYVTALMKMDVDRIVDMSEVPFVGEDKVFTTKAEMKSEILANNPPDEEAPAYEFVSVSIHTPADVKEQEPTLWKLLEKHNLLENVYISKVVLKIEGHEQPGHLVLKQDSQGEWKVIGVF